MASFKLDYKDKTLIVIFVSTLVRILITLFADITAQEAYYKSFALFPEISSFDQPPMIGWLIQLTTNNFSLNSQLFLRLGAIICGILTSWVIFITGRRFFSKATGFYSAVIYNTSFFFSLFTSTYIIPESPFTLFYLLAFYFILESLCPQTKDPVESRLLANNAYILSGIFSGLALLSKYISLAIWPSVILYILVNNRKEFKNKYLYLSLTIYLIFNFLTFILNFSEDFPGMEHLTGSTTISEYHFSEIIFNFTILVLLVSPFLLTFIFQGIKLQQPTNKRKKQIINLIYFISFGNAIPVLILSLFTNEFILSLPTLLFPIVYIASFNLSQEEKHRKSIQKSIKKSSMCYISWITLLIIIYSTGILNYNPFFKPKTNIKESKHFSAIQNSPFINMLIDNYGWKSLSHELSTFIHHQSKYTKEDFYIIANNYLSAALTSYYLENYTDIKIKTAGNPFDTKKFKLITDKNGSFNYGDNAIYIDYFDTPKQSIEFGTMYFQHVNVVSVIYLKRINFPVKKITIYEFTGMTKIP